MNFEKSDEIFKLFSLLFSMNFKFSKTPSHEKRFKKIMTKFFKKTLALQLGLLFSLPLFFSMQAYAKEVSNEICNTPIEIDLRAFRFSKFLNNPNQCEARSFDLGRAGTFVALKDLGSFARQLIKDDLLEYAHKHANNEEKQNILNLVSVLATLPPSVPNYVNQNFKIPIKNKDQVSRSSSIGDKISEVKIPIIELLINDIKSEAIFDTGASFTLSKKSDAFSSLKTVADATQLEITPAGNAFSSDILAVEKVEIGPLSLHNLTATTTTIDYVIDGVNYTGNLVGQDLMFRFDSVSLDMKRGYIEFNGGRRDGATCTNMFFSAPFYSHQYGIGIELQVGNQTALARVDTGLNGTVLIHTPDKFSQNEFVPIPNTWFRDSSGTLTPVEHTTLTTRIGTYTANVDAFRISNKFGEFDLSLGANFFAGHAITFDFKNHQFCFEE